MEREAEHNANAAYLEGLYREYRGLLYATARRCCGTELDAEAAVHDAILRLARHLDTLRRLDPDALAVYLAATVQSVTLNQRRRLNTERRRQTELDPETLEAAEAAPDPETALIERDERDAALRRLREALAELRESDRELLVEKYYAGLDDAALAAKYGISESGVRSRLSRARRRARRIMARKEGEAAARHG